MSYWMICLSILIPLLHNLIRSCDVVVNTISCATTCYSFHDLQIGYEIIRLHLLKVKASVVLMINEDQFVHVFVWEESLF